MIKFEEEDVVEEEEDDDEHDEDITKPEGVAILAGFTVVI